MLWSYELPPERIAQYPIEPRHAARLLLYRKGMLHEDIFLHLAEYLPADSLLLYNDSRVVPARLRQGSAEVLVTEIEAGGWESGSPQRWKGLFRPGRFWRKRSPVVWEKSGLTLSLVWEGQADARQGYFVATWEPPDQSAISVLEVFGEVPLPPYIARSPGAADKHTYQTWYAQTPGSVAAPTAGLHFTPEVWARLQAKGIHTQAVTLHVGLGTFLPLQTPEAPEQHPMHAEAFTVSAEALSLLQRKGDRPLVCVGTTTLRVVESLYWIGFLRLQGRGVSTLPALIWREVEAPLPPPAEALQALSPLSGMTQLYILPGYPFQLAEGLITNFHLPGTTLLGLVEAFIGREGIRQVYEYALDHGFRFLSYGDTSLLWRV